MAALASIPAVLDTNILVSALLSAFGPPARVLDLALAGEIRPVYDDRILAEYVEVLARPGFGFAEEDVANVLAFLQTEGEGVTALPLSIALPEPDNAPFLEVAAQAHAVLITGNARHYPEAIRGPIRVVSLAEFLRLWQQTRRSIS